LSQQTGKNGVQDMQGLKEEEEFQQTLFIKESGDPGYKG
jgi:hypothetical protein